MNVLSKTALAVGFSFVGALTSVSALAVAANNERQIHEIKIEAKSDADVDIYVSANGEVTNMSLPKSELQDKEKLAQALKDVPEKVRQQLIDSLANIHIDEKVVMLGGDSIQRHLSWIDKGDAKHVIVVKEVDGDFAGEELKEIIKEINIGDGKHQVIELHRGDKMPVNSVLRLLEHGKFTQEELDKIQQALDAKR